ncbi:hypothetical protein [Paraburkholderia kirstenboschensis]|uniref:Uncharacterized protein n=1 Tax=Paraburkholderia kirstenboschensis TaxID=1245436 RepID=A0ABZ0ETL5_9BURK|nr:hypothetical protein [Paraburkholderia kirstenboschensis]WOD20265.1 hypothetical protein RW095_29155 [Paraburkholderia kirstenboschensis]
MKNLKKFSMILLLSASYAANCFADGSVNFEQQVLPIINQRPFFADFLRQIFEFDKDAVGVTIGSNVSKGLGLTRIGPYRVCAKLRGVLQSDPCPMQMVVDTDTHFFDKNGKEVDGPEGAQSVRENFYAIEVDPPPNQTPMSRPDTSGSGGKRD